jgi:hypothetical protein
MTGSPSPFFWPTLLFVRLIRFQIGKFPNIESCVLEREITSIEPFLMIPRWRWRAQQPASAAISFLLSVRWIETESFRSSGPSIIRYLSSFVRQVAESHPSSNTGASRRAENLKENDERAQCDSSAAFIDFGQKNRIQVKLRSLSMNSWILISIISPAHSCWIPLMPMWYSFSGSNLAGKVFQFSISRRKNWKEVLPFPYMA